MRDTLWRLALADGDRRSTASHRAQERFLAEVKGEALSIGGGPTRISPRLRNLNIALVGGVDLLGDAHALPIGSGSVGGIHCEAVLEHLEFPASAVSEMYRVLRGGGLAYAATPFLQPFHGYPSHFQNFTLVGHRRLFERAGFEVLEAGCCVGPAFAIAELIRFTLRETWPSGTIGRYLAALWWLVSQPLRFADRALANLPSAHLVCSTTYLLARKPESP
ncbi:MAG: methyltransferase domain-containing protein [Thermoanaerobaculia bacterium]